MSKKFIVLSPHAEVSMADEWFEIASADHFWMIWRFKTLQQSLSKRDLLKPQQRYLEIGCGHGQFLHQSDRSLNIVCDGCDLNKYALDKVSGVMGDVYMYNIFDMQSAMLEKYNGVFLLDVIEHLDDDALFLKAALKHVKPGGLVVIDVPALTSLFSKYDVVVGHKRRYSVSQLHTLFKSCGVEPVEIKYWGFTLLAVAWARKQYLKFVPVDKVIEKGFKPGGALTRIFLKTLMHIELFLIPRAFLGTSATAIGKKTG